MKLTIFLGLAALVIMVTMDMSAGKTSGGKKNPCQYVTKLRAQVTQLKAENAKMKSGGAGYEKAPSEFIF